MGDSQKPVLLLCLDDTITREVLSHLPTDRFDVITINSPAIDDGVLRRHADGTVVREANITDGLHKWQRLNAEGREGFIITDECGQDSMSGADFLMRTHGKGNWHSIMLTGTFKEAPGSVADISISYGADKRDFSVLTHIVSFINSRTTEDGGVLPKSHVTRAMRWHPHFLIAAKSLKTELALPELQLALSMASALEAEIEKGMHGLLAKSWQSPTAQGFVREVVAKDIARFLMDRRGRAATPPRYKLLHHDTIEKFYLAHKELSETEQLEKDIKASPAAANFRAYREVLKREVNGDEPPGSADSFLERLRAGKQSIRFPDEVEKDAIYAALHRDGKKSR